VNDALNMAQMLAELPPLPTLLTAYAPRDRRGWHALCWTLDQRLAAIVRRGGEPTIAAIRLAWWDAVLVEGDASKGRGEPLVDAWRAASPDGAAAFASLLIDGWRGLIGPEALTPDDLVHYGAKRGGGLFGLIADMAQGDALARAGSIWALWDLAGHTSDAFLAQAALAEAQAQAAGTARLPRGQAPKALRLLHGLALADVQAGHVPAGGFEPHHYRALLWRSLLP
jgi:phytoene synthase